MTDHSGHGLTKSTLPWGRVLALTAGGAALVVLHQDFWNWKAVGPLLFGFLPVGLAYHAAFSVACAGYMALLVKFAWPRHLEDVGPHPDARTPGPGHD